MTQNKDQCPSPLKRILIIRLSSFGDIIQTLPTVDLLSKEGYQVDFLTKKEFNPCIEIHPFLSEVISFDKNKGLIFELRKINHLLLEKRYDFIYDAHNNLRTLLIRGFSFGIRIYAHLRWRKLHWIYRPKYRLRRFLFFSLKVRSLFDSPYVAARSFISPLQGKIFRTPQISKNVTVPPENKEMKTRQPPEEKMHGTFIRKESDERSTSPRWLRGKPGPKFLGPNSKYIKNIPEDQNLTSTLPPNFICLAPSAAWPLKRWPIKAFQRFTEIHPKTAFIVIGGPQDQFAQSLKGSNITNLVGLLSWAQTGFILKCSQALVSADTGVLHWADYIGTPCIGILGPTAFGETFRKTSHILNLKLPCSPCSKDGRGSCKIKETQKCLTHIRPEDVSRKLKSMGLL